MAADRGEQTAAADGEWYHPDLQWQQDPASAALQRRPNSRWQGQDQAPLPAGVSDVAVARQVRARGLAAGQRSPEIAAAIVSACGITKIRAYRLALGVSLADVVAQVHARFEADGREPPRFSETLLSAYESGQKRPGTDYLHYVCASYRADPGELGFDARCLCGRSHRGPAGHTGPQPAIAETRTSVTEATVPMPRQDAAHEGNDGLRAMLLQQIAEPGSQVDGRFLAEADRIRRRMDRALLSGTVSVPLLDRWEESTLGYGRQYMSVPPLRLLCDVLLDLAEVRRMCEERQPLDVAERLCRLAAQLAGLAGITMHDLGDHRLARSFFRTARSAADETGDRQLRAWIAARESLVPLYYGDPREAAGLAVAAADLAGRQPCAASVMAPVNRERAQARLVSLGQAGREGLGGQAGQRAARDRARASLDRAQDALADLPPEQRADTALGYTERQLHFHTGDILVTLGDWQAAHRAFSQAGELYASTEVLDRALVGLGKARCLLAADEPDQALTLGREVLVALPPEHRTAVVLQVARSLGRDAARRDRRLPALAGYREALRSA